MVDREPSSSRETAAQPSTAYHRVGGDGQQTSSGRESFWEGASRNSRSQLALITCVVLVLMAGGVTTLRDKIWGPGKGADGKDVGAPAVTGAPAAKGVDAPGPKGIEGVEKIGAGFLFVSGADVLLLKRNSLHNHNKWGLPGGNVDEGDQTLLAAATREAEEELGSVPPFHLKGEIRTMRGKFNEKRYTVFVALLDPDVKASFSPVLNEEHSAWAWIPLKEAVDRTDLHPVVNRALQKPNRKVVTAAIKSQP